MNVFRRELRANLKSLFIWCIATAALIATSIAKTYRSQGGQSMQELVATMPKSIQTIFGNGLLDLSKASGVYGVVFLYISLIATLYAANLGSRIVAKEENDKTFEFLYVKGTSRKKILAMKIAGLLVNLLIFNMITDLSANAIINALMKQDITALVHKLTLTLFVLELLFATLGLFLSVFLKNSKKAAGGTAAILLVMFFISIVCNFGNGLKWMGYLTPFYYFDAKRIILDGVSIPTVLVALILCIVGMAASFNNHQKRDLH